MKRERAIDFVRVSSYVEREKLYLDQNLSIDSLALKLGTNRTAIYEAVRSAGLNFPKFINLSRARHALDLLRRKELRGTSISDIAEMSGFANARHMNFYLRKIVGMVAGDYRARVFGE